METVVAAVVAASGAILVAIITNRSIKGRVGTPNGHGTLIEMVTRLFEDAGEIKGKVDELHTQVHEHTMEDREQFAQVNLRLGNLERTEAVRAAERHPDA